MFASYFVNMMLILFVALPCSVVATSIMTQQCSLDGEVVPHRHNNQLFYQCDSGYWTLLKCDDGYIFDATDGMCYGTVPSILCEPQRPIDCPVGAYIPHDCDCTKYYHCDKHGAVERSCGDGTAFNAKISSCDHIENVDYCRTIAGWGNES